MARIIEQALTLGVMGLVLLTSVFSEFSYCMDDPFESEKRSLK